MDGFASRFFPRNCDVYLHNTRERTPEEHEKPNGDTTREEEDLEQLSEGPSLTTPRKMPEQGVRVRLVWKTRRINDSAEEEEEE